MTNDELDLLIPATPQISVAMTNYGEVEISTARIGYDFASVEINTVAIPLENARDVAKAMLRLLKAYRAPVREE